MEEIRIFVETLIQHFGLSAGYVPLARHAVLVLVVAVLATVAYLLGRKIIIPVVGKITRRTSAQWDDVLLGRRVLLAACSVVPALVVWQLLPLVFYQYPTVREVLSRLTAIYITLSTVHLFIVFIDSLKLLDNGHRASLRQYILSFCGLLRVLVIFFAVIIVISIIIGRNPTTLLAGLGATSAILMLVFKDTIEGLVAGIRLTSAEMLHVGDWITVPSTQADGTVIEMNLTTVKVQNFDNTIVTVSPLTLVNGSFQNWKGMQASDGRRVKRKVFYDFRSLRFMDESREETNMSRYRDAVEKYLTECPWVNADMTLMVRQLEATQGGLPLEFYFFLKNKEWVHYEHALAAIMEHIYVLAGEYGLKVYQKYPEQ
ncbi:MAG: mechanosensitive ion channel [Prevotella sp.]|nr:mechanosensitive ion channel [Prevotella sp.]